MRAVCNDNKLESKGWSIIIAREVKSVATLATSREAHSRGNETGCGTG